MGIPSMTRLFFSLYLFVAISLIVLSAGLNQVFFSEPSELSHEQKAWLQTLDHLPPKEILSILTDTDIDYVVREGDSIALSDSMQKQLEQHSMAHGFIDNQWQIFLPANNNQLIEIRFKQALPDDNRWLSYFGLFFVLLGLLIAVWLYPLWRDLSKLVKTAQEVKQDGTLDVPALGANSPLADIANALLVLEDKIQQLLANQRELTSAVTHEFKTPIARLKFALASETGLSHKQVKEARKDIDELDTLIQEMLDFTKLNRQSVELHVEDIPLFELCEQRVHQLASITPITLSVSGDRPILTADGHLVSRALDNLLTNAIRHANKLVNVTVGVGAEWIYIHVDDDGQGIDDLQKDRIFDAFYRADSGRDRENGGTGLGLAIVKRIQDWHHGKVRVDDSQLGGACFTLCYKSQPSITSA